jgi:hypothetical protein
MPDETDLSFDHVPELTELMPLTGGMTGVEYAQICVENLMTAQNKNLEDVADAFYYQITGPKGKATMRLMAFKDTAPIFPARAGACTCYLDPDIEKHTGLELEPAKEKATDKRRIAPKPTTGADLPAPPE